MRWTSRPVRLLCFDIENKPGTFGGHDFTFSKVTAVGAMFVDETEPRGWILNRRSKNQMKRVARDFRRLWDDAGIVVGHNIRRHDIKILNGLYATLGLP